MDEEQASPDEQLLVTIVEDGADPERLEELGLLLRGDLVMLGHAVEPVHEGDAPAGTRGLEIAAAGALLVALKGSAEAVGGIVAAIRSWLSRGSAARSVEITYGGKSIKLGAATDVQQQQLVEEFVRALNRA